jgi:hypothetical protein
MGAIFLAQVLRPEIQNMERDYDERLFLWKHFGTWVNSMFTIFEITMAPGGFIKYRPLYETVSNPLVAVLFLTYVCLVTFAVVRVITAMFLKATLAASDKDEKEGQDEKAETEKNFLQSLLEEAQKHDDSLLMDKAAFEWVLAKPGIPKLLQEADLIGHEGRLFAALDRGEGFVSMTELVQVLMQLHTPPSAALRTITLHESQRILERLSWLAGKVSSNALQPARKVAEHLQSQIQPGPPCLCTGPDDALLVVCPPASADAVLMGRNEAPAAEQPEPRPLPPGTGRRCFVDWGAGGGCFS